jgi:hypothetical protein
VSGSGKIALHVLEKLIAYGALPITVSGNLFFFYEYMEAIAPHYCMANLNNIFYKMCIIFNESFYQILGDI